MKKSLTEQLGSDDDRADITPLIDVIFMLLLFFIITMTFAEDTFFPIELPKAEHSSTVRTSADAVTVEISKAGEFAVAKQPLPSADALHDALKRKWDAGEAQTVIIKADAVADAKDVVYVLDVLRAVGINEFSVTADAID